MRSILDNPLRASSNRRPLPEPFALVIFGASGNLTHRKLLPALYELFSAGLLPPGFTIVGFARRPWQHEDFRQSIRAALTGNQGLSTSPELLDAFLQALHFCQGDFADQESYLRLGALLATLREERVHADNVMFYLAAPPSTYEVIVTQLGTSGLTRPRTADAAGWTRIVVEKPFGSDYSSARRLTATLQKWFSEEQIYRIDHYLGKETVQNILVFRLANAIFEPIWNRNHIDHVQITVAEDTGVGGRGPYYEEAGALRDMVQNHLLQLLALVAMEPPVTFEAEAVRDEKTKVLRALRPLRGEDAVRFVVRGQYVAGTVNGVRVPGYREEPGVSARSDSETYVALRALVDNWRWAGVPFYLRTGKRLTRRVTEIAIQFRYPPLSIFREAKTAVSEPNWLIFSIQPEEGIALRFGSKVPGPTIDIRSVAMDFRYGTSFRMRSADAYERLLLDALVGDPTLFNRQDAVELSWVFVDGIREAWLNHGIRCEPYEAGSSGPGGAVRLLATDGREWRRL